MPRSSLCQISPTRLQSTIGGDHHRFDLAAAQASRGVLAIITADNALKLHIDDDAEETLRAPLLQDREIHYNGQHVAVVVAVTLEQADVAAAPSSVRYRRDEPVTSMDTVLDQKCTYRRTFAVARGWPIRAAATQTRLLTVPQ